MPCLKFKEYYFESGIKSTRTAKFIAPCYTLLYTIAQNSFKSFIAHLVTHNIILLIAVHSKMSKQLCNRNNHEGHYIINIITFIRLLLDKILASLCFNVQVMVVTGAWGFA